MSLFVFSKYCCAHTHNLSRSVSLSRSMDYHSSGWLSLCCQVMCASVHACIHIPCVQWETREDAADLGVEPRYICLRSFFCLLQLVARHFALPASTTLRTLTTLLAVVVVRDDLLNACCAALHLHLHGTVSIDRSFVRWFF